MGIINVTHDSFFPESRKTSVDQAVRQALSFEAAGADSIDVGGESTRPGSEYVPAEEELHRVIPVFEAIRRECALPLSVDTRKAVVAREAIAAGASMVNDVSAGRDDPEMLPLCNEKEVSVVLMHMRGRPKTMQKNPAYDDPVGEIASELRRFADSAKRVGIPEERIILDPGIGFGKRHQDNLLILKNLDTFKELGYPLLLGFSRKSFLGAIIGEGGAPEPVERRYAASLAAAVWCMIGGAEYLRVHDVEATREARAVIHAIEEVGEE